MDRASAPRPSPRPPLPRAVEDPRPAGLRVVAVDMDGTFLRSDSTLDGARFARVRRAMREAGVRFVVASGNQEAQILSILAPGANGPDLRPDAVLSENGAIVLVGRRRIAEARMDADTLGRVITALEGAPGASWIASGADGAYVPSSQDPRMRDLLTFYFPEFSVVPAARDLEGCRVAKVSLLVPDGVTDELLTSLRGALGGALTPVTSGHDSIDLIMPGRHKAHGLELLLEHWGMSREQVVAFGDSANDVELLRAAGTGVAMANASPAAMQAADLVAPGHDEDGVLAVLEAWFPGPVARGSASRGCQPPRLTDHRPRRAPGPTGSPAARLADLSDQHHPDDPRPPREGGPMSTLHPRVILLDIDGTLVTYANVLPDSAARAVRRARAVGHRLYPVTGRSKAEMPEVITELGFDGFIGGNGSYVEDGGSVVMHQHLPGEECRALVEWLLDRGLAYYLEANSGLYGSPGFREAALPAVRASRHGTGQGDVSAVSVADVFPEMLDGGQEPREDVNKISYVLSSPDDLDAARDAFPALKHGSWGGRGHDALFGDVGVAGISKSHAIDVLVDHLGVELEDTIGFGDAAVDLDMIEHCGVGVAMGNAPESLKAAASLVTDDVEDDGLARAFERLGLLGPVD